MSILGVLPSVVLVIYTVVEQVEGSAAAVVTVRPTRLSAKKDRIFPEHERKESKTNIQTNLVELCGLQAGYKRWEHVRRMGLDCDRISHSTPYRVESCISIQLGSLGPRDLERRANPKEKHREMKVWNSIPIEKKEKKE